MARTLSHLLVRAGAVILLGCALAACASGFKAEVVRFHSDPSFNGEKGTVIPAPPVVEDPAFPIYAELLGQRLAGLGLRPAAGEPADIEAVLGYEVTVRAGLRDRDGGASIGVGVGSFGRRGGVSVGTQFPLDEGEAADSYNRRVTLQLRQRASGDVIWEGRANSVGRTPGIDAVMDMMLQALLTNFPGRSGVSIDVRIDPETGKAEINVP